MSFNIFNGSSYFFRLLKSNASWKIANTEAQLKTHTALLGITGLCKYVYQTQTAGGLNLPAEQNRLSIIRGEERGQHYAFLTSIQLQTPSSSECIILGHCSSSIGNKHHIHIKIITFITFTNRSTFTQRQTQEFVNIDKNEVDEIIP